MPLTEEQKAANRLKREIEFAKTKQVGTYLQDYVAKSLQKAIRAEAAAFVGNVLAVDKESGQVESYASELGECICVTCGRGMQWNTKGCHGGHFLPGRSAHIVLIEQGINPQCYQCNEHDSGAGNAYEKYMEHVYGPEVIQELRNRKNGFTIDLDGKKVALVPLTKEQLAVKRISYMDRIKAAEHKIKKGMPDMTTSIQIASAWEYTNCTKQVKQQLLEIAEEVRKSTQLAAIGVGRLLKQAKLLVPHGEFAAWVESECGIRAQRISEFIRVADFVELFSNEFPESGNVQAENLSYSALVDMTSPGCPQDAVDEIMFLATKGYVGYTDAKFVIDKHKEAKKPPKDKQKKLADIDPKDADEGRIDKAVAGAIDKMVISVEDQPDPAEAPNEEDWLDKPVAASVGATPEVESVMEQQESLWRMANHDQRNQIIEFIESTPEWELKHGTPSAVESGERPAKVKKKKNAKTAAQKKKEKEEKKKEAIFQTIWNNTEGTPSIRSWTESRSNKFRGRLRSDSEWWAQAQEALEMFPLQVHAAENKKSPDVDWFLRPDTVPAILEGRYDFDPTGNGKGSTNGTMEAVAGYLQE